MFASKTKIILPPNMNKSPLVKMYEKPVYKDFFKPKSRVQSIRNQYHRLSSKKPKTTSKPPVEANSEPKTTNKPPVEANSEPKTTNKPPVEANSEPKTTNKPPVETNSEPNTTNNPLVQESSSEKQNIANDQKVEHANKAVKDAESALAVAESLDTLSKNKDFIGAELDKNIEANINKAKLGNKGLSIFSRKRVAPEKGGKTKTRKIKKKGIKK